MNNAQLAKFHVLKSQWAKARKAVGRPGDDAALDALKLRKIGRVCSSKEFSQHDMDTMVAAFLAEIDPANLNAQMAQQDQPDKRRAALMARCNAACEEMADTSCGEYQFGNAKTRQGYIAGLAKKLTGKWPEACTEAELGKVAGVLEARVKQLKRAMTDHHAKVKTGHAEWVATGRPEAGAAKSAMLEPGEDF